ncbi:metallophosphoesterase, partial [Odoribacter sp. OttesenSCG-928-J03]|nr:metallophosphoesterase [Odoribacter sp. OttesenSCG-928-J03]
MNKQILYILLALILFYGCDHVFEYHPYDLNLSAKYKHINQKNIDRILALDQSKDTVRFIMMGDTQRWYDETESFVKAVNKRDDVDFVIHGGDISDFGMKKEYCWVHDIMSDLKVPYVALIGNHDNLGSGREVYEAMYGELNFSYMFRGVKFVCLNTNALDFDYSVAVPDFQFIRKEVLDTVHENYHSTIVVMHT